MKKLMKGLVLGMLLTGFSSCGVFEKFYDKQNYESITNERGDVEIFSGGRILYSWKNAKVIYSDSDSNAMFIETSEGNKYIQDGLVIHLKD